MVYKSIKESEYISSLGKIVSKWNWIIENKLEILGATMSEDESKEKVPETVQRLETAGIKVCVLAEGKISIIESIITLNCNL